MKEVVSNLEPDLPFVTWIWPISAHIRGFVLGYLNDSELRDTVGSLVSMTVFVLHVCLIQI